MTVWRKGYKLLNPYGQYGGGPRMSLCVGHSKYRMVEYPLMEEARPQEGAGPLTVFTRKADIRAFFDRHGWDTFAVVVRCVFIESEDQRQGLWGRPRLPGPGHRSIFHDLPKGTVLADVVLCLE